LLFGKISVLAFPAWVIRIALVQGGWSRPKRSPPFLYKFLSQQFGSLCLAESCESTVVTFIETPTFKDREVNLVDFLQ
jgi:hypothetical protein